MIPLSSGMFLVFLLACGLTALAMMRVFTNIVDHQTELHDLRNQVKQLQYDQQLHLARIQGQIDDEGDIEILDDPEDAIEAVEQTETPAAEVAELIEAIEAHPAAAA